MTLAEVSVRLDAEGNGNNGRCADKVRRRVRVDGDKECNTMTYKEVSAAKEPGQTTMKATALRGRNGTERNRTTELNGRCSNCDVVFVGVRVMGLSVS